MTANKDNIEDGRDVFLSYSSADTKLAETLHQAIIDAGGTAFISAKDIDYGADFAEEIRKQLVDAKQMWIILSPRSLNSEWVLTEWGAAWILKKLVVPILYQCSVDSLPDRLKRLQYVDFHNYKELIDRTFLHKKAITVPNAAERTVIDDLLSRGQIIDAVAEGRKYLHRGQFAESLAVLEYTRDQADPNNSMYYIILGNIAYNLVRLNRDQEALDYLKQVESYNSGETFFAWHAIARAVAYLHLGEETKCKIWMADAKNREGYDQNEVKKHYPELIPYLEAN